MATRTTVTVLDDVDGSKADESVQFSVDGRAYEIDLNAQNAAELRKAFDPYLTKARRIGGRQLYRTKPKIAAAAAATPAPSPAPTPAPSPAPTPKGTPAPTGTLQPVKRQSLKGKPRPTTRRDRDVMRVWARAQGYSVGDKGRISSEVETAWEEAGRPGAD